MISVRSGLLRLRSAWIMILYVYLFLCQEAQARDIPAGTLGERDRKLDHGTMIPLWFLNHYMQDYQVVRIGLSGLPLSVHYQLGQCILKTAQLLDRRVAVIGSGDLSHR